MTLDVALRKLCALAQRNDGFDCLAEQSIRDPDDHCFGDAVEGIEHILDLFGADLISTTFDDVVFPPDKVQKTFLVHPEQIACVQHLFSGKVSAPEDSIGFFWELPIPLHHLSASNQQLSNNIWTDSQTTGV